ncbi:MAG: YmfQ family protein, partial [Gammaproteobacteria bacterium]|nr:YmfQ family protein [Gammaproteobacteria bacterium]
MSAAQYLSQAKALLPRGKLWQSLARIGSTFSDLLEGIVQEFARIDTDAEALLDEMDPLTVTNTIDAWEQFYGLPDSCGDAPGTLDERRDALLARAAPAGKMHRPHLVNQAAVMG